jgi:hypothetical protein
MHDGLQPQVCASCGYSLQGHPGAGRCPECGTTYGPDCFVLWGKDASYMNRKLGEGPFGRTGSLLWGLVTSGAMIAFLLFSPLPTNPVVVLLPGFVFVYFLWKLWQGRQKLQVRLSSEGYAVRLGFGTARLQPWSADEEVDFTRVGFHCYRFTIRRLFVMPATMELKCTDADAESWRARIQLVIGRRVGLEK